MDIKNPSLGGISYYSLMGSSKKNDKDLKKSTYRALSLIGGFGLSLGFTTFVCYHIGNYLDQRLGTSPWFVIGMVSLGICSGFYEYFLIIKRLSLLDEEKDKKRE